MNAPVKLNRRPVGFGSAPSKIRAHLLHRLRTALSPESLRKTVAQESGPLPRQYWQRALGTPLNDFLGRGSKMFRASLSEWAWNAAGGKGDMPSEFGLAVEALHAGSLIVDDIQDQATRRRGDVALHQRYGLATTLNAGNWLYFWPARFIAEANIPPDRELAALRKLSETQYCCHLGQGLDVSLRVQDIRQDDMQAVVLSKTELKTSLLVGLSTYLGALAAGAPLGECESFARFGEELGSVLQKLDDAGTLLSDNRDEKAYEDLYLGTATWPWAWASVQLDEVAYEQLVGLSIDVQQQRSDFSELRGALREVIPSYFESTLRAQLEEALDAAHGVIQGEKASEVIVGLFEKMRHSYV
jgi:geranylgeranyl pyrophosphate synthase